MRMKKSILLSLLAIIALGLGACSNSSNNKQANGQENSAQKKLVKVLVKQKTQIVYWKKSRRPTKK